MRSGRKSGRGSHPSGDTPFPHEYRGYFERGKRLAALRAVIDPEIGCNIVDLGLIYNVVITGPRVVVQMTLTTPGCPMSEGIAQGVQWALLGIAAVEDAEVEILWDPPWQPSMMTDLGRAALGMR